MEESHEGDVFAAFGLCNRRGVLAGLMVGG